MDELLELIRNTDEFKKYVDMLQKYKSFGKINDYTLKDSYKTDPTMAVIECADIEKTEEGISIKFENAIGAIRSGEVSGDAIYKAIVKKENDDLLLNGNIKAEFTSSDNSMFDFNSSYSPYYEKVLDEDFENRFENMGYLYQTKTR